MDQWGRVGDSVVYGRWVGPVTMDFEDLDMNRGSKGLYMWASQGSY